MTQADISTNINNGLISVIIPTHNRAELVREAIQSAIESDWVRIEIIVVDDGSEDETQAVLGAISDEALGQTRSLIYLHQTNQGPASARNAGLERATGEFVYFLDSDDLVLSGGISLMVSAIEDNGAPYCVAQMAETDRKGRMVFKEGTSLSVLDHQAVVPSQWATHAALYRRSALDAAGRFNTALLLGEDKEYLWRIVRCNDPGVVIDDVVALRRNHGLGQLSDSFTSLTMGQSALGSLASFTAWCEADGQMTPTIGRALIRPLAIALVRIGASGDSGGLATASALLGRLSHSHGSLHHKIVSATIRALPSWALKSVMAGLSLVRSAIHWRRNRQQEHQLPALLATGHDS